jgi:hypothetical protein
MTLNVFDDPEFFAGYRASLRRERCLLGLSSRYR